MANGLRPHRAHGERLRDRLERAARDINAVLLVLAIGLAALDATCFFLLEMADAVVAAGKTATHQTAFGQLPAAAIVAPGQPVAQAAIPPATAAGGHYVAAASVVRSGSR